MARGDGIGFWYRLRWNIVYGLLTVGGPPQLDERQDPRARMRADRAERERQAAERRQRGAR